MAGLNPRSCKLSKARGPGTCAGCGKELAGRQTQWCGKQCPEIWANNHLYSHARTAVRRRDKYKCVMCGAGKPIQVDHMKQAMGSHAKASCLHHQNNLRCLCIPCHLLKTKLDRAKRKVK